MQRDKHNPPRNTDPVIETRDRVRRIETRLTKALIHLGVDTGSQSVAFDADGPWSPSGKVTAPSPNSTVKEVLAAIPNTFAGPVELFVGDQHFATIRKAPPAS